MKIFIKTYGCQANIADSEQIAGLLTEGKHELVHSDKDADAIIVNTCSVKNKTQSKILHYLRKNTKQGQSKPKRLIVGGCLTKTINIRKKIPEVDAVFDTNSILKINEIIKNPHDAFSDKKENRIAVPVIRSLQGIRKEIGIITIGEGCINKCTFCATKLARGSLRSYRVGDIKRSLEKAVKDGCKKIYITSQDNGCYGFDIKTNLPELLSELVAVPGDYKIRVGMMNPWHIQKMLNKLIDAYKNKKIMKFLHIPVQSGSEKVLKDMKRMHTVQEFVNAISAFKHTFPKITIATDIIVGYPTETEEDFMETYKLIESVKPEVVNISKFSSRHGTFAATLKQLPSQIIDERSQRLSKLILELKKPACSKHVPQ